MRKALNYKMGALKRTLKTGKSITPGDLIAKMNARKMPRQKKVDPLTSRSNAQLRTIAAKKKTAVAGLI